MKLADMKSLTDVILALPDEKAASNLLFDEGLIKTTMDCSKCGNAMKLRNRGTGYEWRCRTSKSKDCSSKSIRDGSFFSKTKLTLLQSIKVIVLWIQKYSAKQISNEVNISEQTVCDWRNYLREMCTLIESTYGKLGGNGNIVEIDETNLHSKKYGIGKGAPDDWAIGGIDRTTGKVFAQRVPNRTAKTLVPILQASVDKHSTVYSDEWRSYSQLKHYFSEHYTVCHKIQFVNLVGSRRVCTNGVEAMWSRLKAPFKSGKGTSQSLLDSYISEFVVRENEKDGFFGKILDHMKSNIV